MYSRNITQNLLDALSDTPVAILHGSRQTGKSTLVRELGATAWPSQYLTFDDITTLTLARRDPAGFLAGLRGPVILDEIQRVPALLLAIKAEVDRDRRPGRFLLTGSAQVLQLPRLADTLAGRLEILTLWPLSQGELEGVREGFIDALFDDEPFPLSSPERLDPQMSGRASLVERMLAGGYPEVLTRPREERRRAWFESYLGAILLRDVRDLTQITGLIDLPRLLAIVAARSGGLLNYADLARDAGLNQPTFKRYFTLLEALFLVRTIRPWFTNRIKRLMKSEKVYQGDTGLMAYLTGLTAERLEREPTVLGGLVENFVAMELQKQQTWSRTRPELFHYRDYSGTEVDFVLESPGSQRVVGIEVKARATVGPADFKGLKVMAGALGETFHRGIVLYTGTGIVPFGANLHAVPISALWRMGAVPNPSS